MGILWGKKVTVYILCVVHAFNKALVFQTGIMRILYLMGYLKNLTAVEV